MYLLQAKNQNEEYILHKNGNIKLVIDIVNETSNDLYQSQLHYNICKNIARSRVSTLDLQKILENIYALKSKSVRKATAIIAYVQRCDNDILNIKVNGTTKNILRNFSNTKLNYIGHKPEEHNYIELEYVKLLLIKALIHKLYRFCSKKYFLKNTGKSILRAWVDVSAELYPNEIRSSSVLIYPFALNFVRQFRFILWCHQAKINFSLYGLSYSLYTIFSKIINRTPNDILIAEIEFKANSSHSKELANANFSKIYTSDEFEVASFVLYRDLVACGAEIVNSAHGVGNYCAHIEYSLFRAITSSQINFYKINNPNIKYNLLCSKMRTIKGLNHYKFSLNKDAAIVLIHQPFDESGLIAEHNALHLLHIELERVAKALSIHYVVKLHPNTKKNFFLKNNQYFNITNTWSDIAFLRPIFITINSTVFFDTRGLGPIIVYSPPTFDPSLYYSPPFTTFALSETEKLIKSLVSIPNWLSASAMHAVL